MSCVESYRGLASPQYECKNGDTYRGFLDETEDNMNCILKDATRTDATDDVSDEPPVGSPRGRPP